MLSAKTKRSKQGRFALCVEEYEALEAMIFGTALFKAAFLLRNASCREWYDYRRKHIRRAQSAEAVAQACKAARHELPYYLLIAGGLPKRDEAARHDAEKNEASLMAEAEDRLSRGLPSLYDRFSGDWVGAREWRPIPGVDEPDRQVFHPRIES